MADGFDELTQLAADLNKGVDVTKARNVVEASALNVREQLRGEARGSRHFGKIAGTITHEMHGYLDAEVGPEKRGAGNLGAIAYFGGVNGGGGTLPDPEGALAAEQPLMMDELGKLGQDYL